MVKILPDNFGMPQSSRALSTTKLNAQAFIIELGHSFRSACEKLFLSDAPLFRYFVRQRHREERT